MNTSAIFCIDCRQPISLESQPIEGEIITCTSCGADLEIVGLEPVELDWAYLEPAGSDQGWLWWNREKRVGGTPDVVI